MSNRFVLGLMVVSVGQAALAQSPQPADKCAPQYAFFGDNQGVMRPREIDPCAPPEIVKAATALGMARYSPPTVKSVVTAQWEGSGTLRLPGSATTVNATRMRMGLSYAVPGIRLEVEGTDADGKAVSGIYVAAGRYAWNETKPGIGATPVPREALDDRLPLIWLTPHGAIWAAMDGEQLKVTQSGSNAIISSTIDGMMVTTTLGAGSLPERTTVRTQRSVFEARYSDYFDPDGYRVVVARGIEWTQDGRPLARLTITGGHANMYVVFPIPASIKQSLAR